MKGTKEQIAMAQKMVMGLLNSDRTAPETSRDGKGNNSILDIANGIDRETYDLRREVESARELKEEFFSVFQYHGVMTPTDKNSLIKEFRERLSGATPSTPLEQVEYPEAWESGLDLFNNRIINLKSGIETNKISVESLRDTDDNLRNIPEKAYSSEVIEMCTTVDRCLRNGHFIGLVYHTFGAEISIRVREEQRAQAKQSQLKTLEIGSL